MVMGHIFSQFKESRISDLESQINGNEERTSNIEKPIQKNIENQSKIGCIINNYDQSQTDVLKIQSVSTPSSQSASLLPRISVASKKTINTTADMALTDNITNNAAQERSLKRKSYFGDESVFDGRTKKRRSVPNNDNSDALPLSCIIINDTPTEVPTNSDSTFTKGTAIGENLIHHSFSEISGVNVSKNENKQEAIRLDRSYQDITSSQSTHVHDSSEELNRNKNVGNRKPTKVSKPNLELPTFKNVSVNRKSLRFSSANAPESTESHNLVVSLEHNVASTLPNSDNVVNSESLHTNRRSSRFTRSSDALAMPSSLTDESSGNDIGESVHITSQNSNDVSASKLFNGGSPNSQSQILLPTVLIDKCDHYLEQASRSNKSTDISSLRVTVDNEGLDANPKLNADVLVPVEQPLLNNKSLTRVSKDSDNMSPLRISLGSEELKTSPKSKSGFLVPTEQLVHNNRSLTRISKNSDDLSPLRISADSTDLNTRRRSTRSKARLEDSSEHKESESNSRRTTRSSKNSETMPCLRVSLDSGDKAKLTRKSSRLNKSNTAKPIESAMEKEPENKTTNSQRKRPATATQPATSGPPTVVNDATQSQRTQFSELTLENVALLQSQLAPAQGSTCSTSEFIDKPKSKRALFAIKARNSIVCTRMNNPEVNFFNEVVEKLGTFFVEDEVTENTTHLVVGESKGTINLLKAICRGCWILKKEWLLNSMESGKWLEEEDYELIDFSPAIKKCRIEKQALGDFYSMDIFNDCDPIYISQNSNPKRSDLIQLIKLCKGTLAKELNNAKIIIADWIDKPDVYCVTEKWVLDSVMYNKKKSFNAYLIRDRS